MNKKKLRIGWFSFSCCEDSTIIFTELLNEHYREWLQLLDIRYMRILRQENVLDEMEAAFVEGAIASEEQAEKLKEIRAKSKKLVAIGACAIVGQPSGQRNQFSAEQKSEIGPILQRFRYKDKVLKLADIVAVDDNVPGCPMNEKIFIDVLNKYLKEFNLA